MWHELEGVIQGVIVEDERVEIATSAGTWRFKPYGDCCAYAYVHEPKTAQAELEALIGQIIVKAEKVIGPELDSTNSDAIEVRDVIFYKLQAEKGAATVTLYVDHNGYYGGALEGGKVEP